MKHISVARILGIYSTLAIILSLSACRREINIDLDKGFSSQIQQIVPQPILDSLRKRGMVINEGLIPPKLSGIYYIDKNILQVPFGPDDRSDAGDVFASYYYRFYGQDANGNITYDYSTEGKTDVGSGKGAFISGNGNKFTIFSEQVGVTSNITNKQLTVLSGEISEAGIINWQNAFVLTDKGPDPTNKLIPVTKGRIFKDADGLSVQSNYYPSSIEPEPRVQTDGPVRQISILNTNTSN